MQKDSGRFCGKRILFLHTVIFINDQNVSNLFIIGWMFPNFDGRIDRTIDTVPESKRIALYADVVKTSAEASPGKKQSSIVC